MNIKRYDIYFANLSPTVGSEINKTRPVVIVSQDVMNKHLNTVVVCPITSKIHLHWRTRLQIQVSNKDAEIAVDQIRTISKSRLTTRIDSLSENNASKLRKLITDMYGE